MKRYFAACILFIAISCTNTDKKVGENAADSTAKNLNTNTIELKDSKVQNIYNDYISLKDALVATKPAEVQKTATELKASLADYKGCENTAVLANKIATATDIALQRKEFLSLSSDVIALFQHADLKKGVIYVQHCPMANKGNGGDWLAAEQKIQNPYYGDQMMECGSVVQEIKVTK